jgi:hypothetical protein
MITTITLAKQTRDGWIARLDDTGDECFVPIRQLEAYDGNEFTAILKPNERGYPKWFCHRLRPTSMLLPGDVFQAMRDMPIIGYSHAAEMGYAAGLCDKVIAMRDGKPIDSGGRTWYVENSDEWYLEELG